LSTPVNVITACKFKEIANLKGEQKCQSTWTN
jgi:hypothetical protein